MLWCQCNRIQSNYSKTSGNLWHYYRDNPTDQIVNSQLFRSKIKITRKALAAGNVKGIKLSVPLKYLSNFWRTLQMPSINCEINLILTLSQTVVISSATGSKKFAITDTKLYVPVVTLSTEDNIKLLKELECDFKRTINWKKYHSESTEQVQNRYLD